MRCLALAEAVRERGAEVSFVSREEPGHIIATIEKRRFAINVLPADKWSPAVDASRTVAALNGAAWVVVDRYGIDDEWERTVSASGAQLLAFDDAAQNRRHATIILNQNHLPGVEERYAELCAPSTQTLLGPRYAPLEKEWGATPRRERSGVIERVLISFGGADPNGETLKAMKGMALLAQEAPQCDVVVGPANKQADAIRTLAKRFPQMTLHPPQNSLLALTERADLVIGALGVATWERMSRGVPSLVIVIADNQRAPAAALGEGGYVLNLGEAAEVTPQSIAAAVTTLRSAPGLVRHLGERGGRLVDGGGADRVARRLVRPSLSVRPATEKDGASLLRWRNDATTRANSFTTAVVTQSEHEAWLRRTLANPERTLLIGEHGGEPVGVVRFDHEGENALVSLTVAPSVRGAGVGRELLEVAHQWVGKGRPELRRFRAEIKPGNHASISLFSRCGYREIKSFMERDLT